MLERRVGWWRRVAVRDMTIGAMGIPAVRALIDAPSEQHTAMRCEGGR
jgi:hypothetical protein